MGFIAIKCPSCGAAINIKEHAEVGYCTYCGTKIIQDKTILEHKGSISITLNDPKINEYKTKLANAKNQAKLYFLNGAKSVRHNKLSGYDAVLAYFSDAEIAGGNIDSDYYEALADFYIKANLAGFKTGERVLISRDKFLETVTFFYDNAIEYCQDPITKARLNTTKNEKLMFLHDELSTITEGKLRKRRWF